jgi:hypothetical protein
MGEVLGATQILKKIKAESKENRSRFISEPPWLPPKSKGPCRRDFAVEYNRHQFRAPHQMSKLNLIKIKQLK